MPPQAFIFHAATRRADDVRRRICSDLSQSWICFSSQLCGIYKNEASSLMVKSLVAIVHIYIYIYILFLLFVIYIYIYIIYIVCISMPIAPRTPPPISSVDHSLRGGNPVCHLWSPEGKSSTPTMVFTMVSEGCLVMFNMNGGQGFPWFQYYHKSSWLLSIWLFLTIYKYTIPLIMLNYITIHFIG